MRTWRSWIWLVPLLLAGLAGCGLEQAGSQAPGKAGSVNLSLTTVPTVRSITVSPGKAAFGDCSAGSASDNTASTTGRLGFPNGHCLVGSPAPDGIFPIKITNVGIASYIDVNGSSASPADNAAQWSLCDLGRHPAVVCTGHKHNPGLDQYMLENFSAFGLNASGLTGNPECDREFGPSGRCWAVQGASQTEGVELIGPSASSDSSTSWTLTITWTPVP